ncbi:dehydrogenase [Bacillus sp. HMF5848]|uniref:TorD/DmsD family molecular chaperone n=1 Tax=Bacillus sp. HMF5848 TaxID=2495421 RepID=UPI000F77F0D6|nr:molecular chaperone TorD family protein [Bacillus sp. HMF5848]RSK28755.1 dehydrogenase [Bacillus sp. HMF5848]
MIQQKSYEVVEIQNLLELRMFAYDILRRVFLEEPVKELIAQFQSGILSFFPFKEENQQLKEGIELVDSYFHTFKMDENFEDLHWDYTRMFIGPHELPVHIWESSYVNKYGLLFQEETLRVRRIYLEYGLETLQYGREADDHLGLELDFMYHLSKLANDITKAENQTHLRKILSDQENFLKEHLLNWIPTFSKKVIDNAETDFYKGIVKVLKGFLIIDNICLEELLARTK